jgi:mannose-6-phosphate isomerase-like protein (cupin superfamily)
MARRIVKIAKTGETFVFDDAWNDEFGRVRKLLYRLEAGSRKVPSHAHPGVKQGFEVVTGVLCVASGGRTLRLQPGEGFVTERGAGHSQWNHGKIAVEAIETYDPPLDVESFFQRLPTVTESGNAFKAAIFFDDYADVVAAPNAVVRGLLSWFACWGRRFGLGGWYR